MQDVGIKDDLLLGVIVLCGTASLDPDCSSLLVQSGIPDLLITILKGQTMVASLSRWCFQSCLLLLLPLFHVEFRGQG